MFKRLPESIIIKANMQLSLESTFRVIHMRVFIVGSSYWVYLLHTNTYKRTAALIIVNNLLYCLNILMCIILFYTQKTSLLLHCCEFVVRFVWKRIKWRYLWQLKLFYIKMVQTSDMHLSKNIWFNYLLKEHNNVMKWIWYIIQQRPDKKIGWHKINNYWKKN